MIHMEYYLIVSAIMFFAGIYGFFTRRNTLAILISIELILENRFSKRYKELFTIIITSLSDKVSQQPGKWHCHLFAQEYSIGRFEKNEDGEPICVTEEL